MLLPQQLLLGLQLQRMQQRLLLLLLLMVRVNLHVVQWLHCCLALDVEHRLVPSERLRQRRAHEVHHPSDVAAHLARRHPQALELRFQGVVQSIL